MTSEFAFPPGLIMMLGALLIPLLGERQRLLLLLGLPVGMDGVPRFSESGPTGIPVGVTGQWTAPIVFEMAYDEVAGPNHLHIRGDFGSDADSVTLLFTDPAGQFLPQVVPSTASLSCP